MKDLVLDNYDLEIRNGDFVIEDSHQQEVDLILRTTPGDWKNSPLTGADLYSYLLNENVFALKKNIRRQLSADNKELYDFRVEGGQIYIDA